ncbi:hypothetical protein PPERSA_12122 [Pseudocohnilembus persalinus]|uniref:Nucleolar protein 56 n=1 Tax=Pseudocohnilembus persalinus TaxID=266149 RepID=A0A0V0QP41_PSEPJ|nr:hypothetical protein PPERSA_12122 [Pseudocohnilembus persalinus]|eukprot:KRX03917.1 hypothetical protein PPERSA_12122 [Pseudocohnilembus persalinus]
MVLYLVHEAAIGLAVFEVKQIDETNAKVSQVQESIQNFEQFSQMVRLRAFQGFDAHSALESAKELGSGNLTELLTNLIETNIPKQKKKGKVAIGFLDKSLAKQVSDKLQYECIVNDVTFELFRGLRTHFIKFLKTEEVGENDIVKAQIGLGHQYSRTKIQFDVNRQDKPIIQSLAVLELLDKDINTFCMRLKEWFGYHFPELAKIVTDNEIYSKLVSYIQNKSLISDEMLDDITEITLDGEIAQSVIDAGKTSMGQELAESDQVNIVELANRCVKQFAFRKDIGEYLKSRMENVAPNLTAVVGENVGAKLVSHAGGLSNLVKYPASTVQILGAEKALFRALKKKGNTPKYGLLYHSSFIGKAAGKDKGKISRYLANKCSIAARLDFFLVNPTNKFGSKMKSQIEERLRFLSTGGTETTKNVDAMEEVLNELKDDNLYYENEEEVPKKKSKKNKKNKKASVQVVEEEVEEEEVEVAPKKSKKNKNKKKSIQLIEEELASDEEVVVVKKKKNKKNKKQSE